MIPLISVINQSERMTDEEVAKMVIAVSNQLARDVAPIWGHVPALEFVPRGGEPTRTFGAALAFITDKPDVDGALGYHDMTPLGVPFLKVFVDPILDHGGTTLAGAESVSVTFSHEVIELVGDASANLWADGPDGSDFAHELCDAVQGDSYELGGVAVSNFLYPAFFDPKAAPNSRLDHMGLLAEPFAMTPGGYQIHRTEPGSVDLLFAHHPRAMTMARGIHVVFGPDFPSWKRSYKTRKAKSRERTELHRNRPRTLAPSPEITERETQPAITLDTPAPSTPPAGTEPPPPPPARAGSTSKKKGER